MRIVLWNCNNGIGSQEQISHLLSFRPDVAIIPEMKESNIPGLFPNEHAWITNNHSNSAPKGLGVLTYNSFKLDQKDRDEDMELFLPLTISKGDFEFNLLAVWNFYHACKQGRFKNLKGPDCLEYSALRHYDNFLKEKPSIVAGDWNLGPTFSQKAFLEICGILNLAGLQSLYHKHFDLKENESRHSTFKGTRGQLHHLDHIFGSRFFTNGLEGFSVGHLEKAIRSDHAPLIVDVAMQEKNIAA